MLVPSTCSGFEKHLIPKTRHVTEVPFIPCPPKFKAARDAGATIVTALMARPALSSMICVGGQCDTAARRLQVTAALGAVSTGSEDGG